MERPLPHQEPYAACETSEPAFRNSYTGVFCEGIYSKTMWVSEQHIQGSLLCVQDKGGLNVPSDDGKLTLVLGQDRLPHHNLKYTLNRLKIKYKK